MRRLLVERARQGRRRVPHRVVDGGHRGRRGRAPTTPSRRPTCSRPPAPRSPRSGSPPRVGQLREATDRATASVDMTWDLGQGRQWQYLERARPAAQGRRPARLARPLVAVGRAPPARRGPTVGAAHRGRPARARRRPRRRGTAHRDTGGHRAAGPAGRGRPGDGRGRAGDRARPDRPRDHPGVDHRRGDEDPGRAGLHRSPCCARPTTCASRTPSTTCPACGSPARSGSSPRTPGSRARCCPPSVARPLPQLDGTPGWSVLAVDGTRQPGHDARRDGPAAGHHRRHRARPRHPDRRRGRRRAGVAADGVGGRGALDRRHARRRPERPRRRRGRDLVDRALPAGLDVQDGHRHGRGRGPAPHRRLAGAVPRRHRHRRTAGAQRGRVRPRHRAAAHGVRAGRATRRSRSWAPSCRPTRCPAPPCGWGWARTTACPR